MKYKLVDMSWKEAQETFKKSDTVIVPTGTLHAHGPTPIGIDATAAERLAKEVGARTHILTLPVVSYGEDDKMSGYPGSIGISPHTLELYYTDICMNLRRNGIRKVIFINGHGGNREVLLRTGYKMRKYGMIIAVLEWWSLGVELGFFKRDAEFLEEFKIGLAIHGKEAADLRGGTFKGEWGAHPCKQVLGNKIKTDIFYLSKFRKGTLMIPLDAWDTDLTSPPFIGHSDLPKLEAGGKELITKLADYIADFAREFQKLNVKRVKSGGRNDFTLVQE